MLIGFHASHEQHDPREMLQIVRQAEAAGFEHAMCSDHFAPWSVRQGHSGFAWSWLGSALEATQMSFGIVSAPGQRYHPAILAQAIATLGQMYPDRLWVALGSGQALNEHITGEKWPSKPAREQRLNECARVITALLAGEEVSHDGLVQVDQAKLWSLPEQAPPLFAAAVTAPSAARVAQWAHGMVTVNQPGDQVQRTIEAYRDAGGVGPVAVQVHVCLESDRETALQIAHDQWRTNVFTPPVPWDVAHPEHFDDVARFVDPEDVEDAVIVTDDPIQIAETIAGYADAGADRVYLHHVGREQDDFCRAMGAHVLPEFSR